MELTYEDSAIYSSTPDPAEEQILPKDVLDVYIDGIEHLPPTPALMAELLAIFKQPDHDIDDVVRLISRDPSLTAEVLKRCNSAYFGGENAVAGMFEAVSRMGFYEVYRVVVMISGVRTMTLQTAAAGLEVEVLWRHSLATAVAAGVIAKKVSESEASAFTAGLLHDVGKIVLASAEGVKYGSLANIDEPRGGSLIAAEKDAFGFDHAEVGGRLLTRWNLPADVVAAIRHHHELAGAGPFARLAATVAFADVMAHAVDGKSATEAEGLANGAEAMALLKLDPEAVTSIMASVRKDLERDASLMANAA